MPPTFCRLRAAAPLSCFSFIRINIKQIHGKGAKKIFTPHCPPPLICFHHLVLSMCSWPFSWFRFRFNAHSADFCLWSCIKWVDSTLTRRSLLWAGQGPREYNDDILNGIYTSLNCCCKPAAVRWRLLSECGMANLKLTFNWKIWIFNRNIAKWSSSSSWAPLVYGDGIIEGFIDQCQFIQSINFAKIFSFRISSLAK